MQWVRNHFSDEQERDRAARLALQKEVERLTNVNTNMQTQLNTLEDRINRMTQRAGPYDEANPPPRPRRVLPASFGGLRGGAQIFVKTLTGKTIVINDIGLADSVYTFKTKIRRKLHISFAHEEEFYLVFGGRRLNDHNDLHSHNIASGSTVFMIMRLRGGGKQDPCCKKHWSTKHPGKHRLLENHKSAYLYAVLWWSTH